MAETEAASQPLTLEHFGEHVDTTLDIVVRNLQWAAELVTSFKLVAMDQTSSQRREFDLRDLVDEILLTLHPTLKHTPFKVAVEAPEGLSLDSFPGPLGQALVNLLNNAVLHGLEGRSAGNIRLSAEPAGDSHIRLTVADDGRGIDEPLLGRSIDPFVTSRMGSGGAGLGLHAVHNVVTNVPGGSISVRSQRGEGTAFEKLLPDRSPHVATQQAADFKAMKS